VRDDDVMRRAIALARDARRHTAPWPAVGCVLVRDGEVVGEGATGPFPTGPHAEVAALRDAGDRAAGATAYSTLEPCDHHGNTPPCTEALIGAGVTRVVVAVDDPDEKVSGRGYARLRAAGIDVQAGVGTAEAARDLAPYLHHRRTGRAFMVAKVALSLDGRVAAAASNFALNASVSARQSWSINVMQPRSHTTATPLCHCFKVSCLTPDRARVIIGSPSTWLRPGCPAAVHLPGEYATVACASSPELVAVPHCRPWGNSGSRRCSRRAATSSSKFTEKLRQPQPAPLRDRGARGRRRRRRG